MSYLGSKRLKAFSLLLKYSPSPLFSALLKGLSLSDEGGENAFLVPKDGLPYAGFSEESFLSNFLYGPDEDERGPPEDFLSLPNELSPLDFPKDLPPGLLDFLKGLSVDLFPPDLPAESGREVDVLRPFDGPVELDLGICVF